MTSGSGSQEKTGSFQFRGQLCWLCRRTNPGDCWTKVRLHSHLCLYILNALFSNRTLFCGEKENHRIQLWGK